MELFSEKRSRLSSTTLDFYCILTLPIPIPDKEKKINLNLYFHSSVWCLKKFYEGLQGLTNLIFACTNFRACKMVLRARSCTAFACCCGTRTFLQPKLKSDENGCALKWASDTISCFVDMFLHSFKNANYFSLTFCFISKINY